MSILRRELAPITPEAWKEIEEVTQRKLALDLAARKLVDVDGPYGWGHGAVDLGRLDLDTKKGKDGSLWGLRRVLPLVEIRVPFKLSLMELDNAARGAKDIDVDAAAKAAERVAHFEDSAIFNGLAGAGIDGILSVAPHKAITVRSASDYTAVVVEASEILRDAGINGPYALVLGTDVYKELARATNDGYPVRRQLERQALNGPIIHAPSFEGGALISTRGGDYELTIGQDLSIGYASHNREEVELYLTESFTFRVLEPAAAVSLRRATSK
jgi:uncharacterized linocin/CFP29 family protein